MNRRFHPFFIVILILMAIGIMFNMMTRPFELIVAIIVFGGVFVLWKFPPSRWQKTSKLRKPARSSSNKRTKERRKHVPFRVIQGNKRDDDEPPEKPHTYH